VRKNEILAAKSKKVKTRTSVLIEADSIELFEAIDKFIFFFLFLVFYEMVFTEFLK